MNALLRGWFPGGGLNNGKEGSLATAFLRCFFAALLLLSGTVTVALAQQVGGGGGVAAVTPQPTDLWHQAAYFLVQPWATIGFLVAGCLLIYWDLLTPRTWDWSGTLGVLSVGLVFASQITIGDTGWVGVLLLLVGLAAVLLEIHVFPGYGSAIAGFVLMYAGMFLSLGGTEKSAFALTVTTILTIVTGVAFLAYLPKSPAWQRLSHQMHQQAGLAAEIPATASDVATAAELIGQTGRVLTDLRPAGLAELNGMRLQVVTEGDFLTSGVAIVVTEVEGDRVVVSPVTQPQTTSSTVSLTNSTTVG